MANTTTSSKKSKPDNLQLNDLVAEFVAINIPKLARNKKHFAKDLMGSDLWKTLEKGMQHEIGGVIYKMVERKLLPLNYAGKTGSNKHTYWLY